MQGMLKDQQLSFVEVKGLRFPGKKCGQKNPEAGS